MNLSELFRPYSHWNCKKMTGFLMLWWENCSESICLDWFKKYVKETTFNENIHLIHSSVTVLEDSSFVYPQFVYQSQTRWLSHKLPCKFFLLSI